MFRNSLIFLSIFTFSFSAIAQESSCGKNFSSLVVSEKTGQILYEKRSDKVSYPASLVQMMTLYLTFESLEKKRLKLDQVLTVTERGEEIARVNNGNTLRLKRGDKITVREAISGVVVKSFNEAAVTLAEAVAGSEWAFVREMNKKALELGMVNSSFSNASGLHDQGQYTNSYDLARLAIALKRNFPQYYNFFAMKSFSYRGQKYVSHNHVLLEYKGAEGMKTGFTNASGFNLVSAAKRNNERIISIVLGCSTAKSRDKLTKQLLDMCFQKLDTESSSNNLPKLDLNGYAYCEVLKKKDEPEPEKVEVKKQIQEAKEDPQETEVAESEEEVVQEEIVQEPITIESEEETKSQAIATLKPKFKIKKPSKKTSSKKLVLKKGKSAAKSGKDSKKEAKKTSKKSTKASKNTKESKSKKSDKKSKTKKSNN